MSVITRRGDDGQTDLMFGRRTSKTSPRLEAYGTVDELNAVLGVARALGLTESSLARVDAVQECLVGLMGELATLGSDMEEYARRGYPRVGEADVAALEAAAQELEDGAQGIRFRGWARPGQGASAGAAQLDLARAVCRRAERRVGVLREAGDLLNPSIPLFLNRLSDLLWLLARFECLGQDQPASELAHG